MMREEDETMRQGRAARLGTLQAPMTLALICVALACCAMAASSALAAPWATRHECRPSRPGRATCMSMRLLLPSDEGSASGSAADAGNATTDAAQAAPQSIRTKPYPGYLTPELLHEAYEQPNETTAGATQTIALIDAFNDPTIESDLAVYDSQFGLPACTAANGCFKKVDEEGKASPLPENEGEWATEISIDVEMAHAICQNCHLLLVEASTEEFSDLGAAVNTAVKLGAGEISNSYGGTEIGEYRAVNSADYNHPGLLISASSGDCGYLNKDCRGETGANFPADSPDVLAVGGTTLQEVSGGGWRSTVWSEGGSGCSTVFSAPIWQSEVANFSATGCGSERAIADVSAVANPDHGVDVYDSTPEYTGGPTGWGVWGGTSVASPIVAAEAALAGGSNGVAYPAQTIYSHAGEAQALYDITAGNNGSCGTATICTAATGYDGPSGVGSPLGLEAFSLSGAPKDSSPPTISGNTEEGQTLTAHHGEWTGEPTAYSYQWERCATGGSDCVAITSASEVTYKLASADVGSTIRLRVTAKNNSGSRSALSAVTATIASNSPTITSLSPSSGITGSTIVLEGTGLGSTSQAEVDKLEASFAVVSSSRLEITVPDGASSGKVSLTTSGGTATSKARYDVTLSIKSFKPASGATGTSVTIKGVGFNRSSKVYFDGTAASGVTETASTTLKATVPAGAGSGPITVTNTTAPVGTVASAQSFAP
jgi:hypothetical protein